MRIGGLRYIRGVNAYARQPIAIARLALDGVPAPLEEAVWRRLADALRTAGVVPGDAAFPEPGATADGAALAQAAIDALLRAVGAPDSSAVERRGETLARVSAVVVPLGHATVARLAIAGGVAIARAALAVDGGSNAARQASDLLPVIRDAWEKWDLDVEHREVATTCERMGIPWKRLSYMPGAMQLGEGAAHVKLYGLITGTTSNFATRLARDKASTSLRLLQHGFPIARTRVVETRAAAREAAAQLGFPMVLKPRASKWNRGVAIVFTADQIDAAFDAAAEIEGGVVAECYIPGREYRMLVAGGVLCGVHERVAPTVIGDGHATVAALIERANADPARLTPDGAWGAPIKLTELTQPYLRHQGFALDRVPPAGAVVGINPLPFRKYGATYRDAGHAVHPVNERLAIEVAALVDLDVAGLDVRMVDIARPWTDGPAAICEVNAGPGIDNIAVTGRAAGVDISRRLIEQIAPAATCRPMPFVLLAGLDDPDAAAAAVAERIDAALGWRVGLALPGHVRIGGRDIRLPANQGAFAAIEVLVEAPKVDAGIVAFPVNALIDHGLVRDRYDVAVVGGGDPAHAAILRALLAETKTPVLTGTPPSTLPDRLSSALQSAARADDPREPPATR